VTPAAEPGHRSRKIGIVFDFDDTLAHDSTTGFLEWIGVDAASFWTDRVQPLLDDGWDPIPAYLYELIRESDRRPAGDRVTRDRLREWGERITFYSGVKGLFGTLRKTAREIDASIELEFYLISSGIGEILRATSVAGEFRDIWACDFAYGDGGEIVYPRNVVSFTEKTRFLFQVSKGLVGEAARGNPGAVNEKVQRGGFVLPFSQMVMVGDGHTDVPCFSLVQRYGGYAFGVYDPHQPVKWGRAFEFIKQQRVASLYTANYREKGDLRNALIMAVRDIARTIAGASSA
jgi:hypothetical protein